MNRRHIIASALAVSVGLSCFWQSTARAQNDNSGPTASAVPSTKQEQKAQRKTERKANRAKKNAELSTLEKNGYNPAQDQTNYPQNLESAEQKIHAQKQGVKPASAP